MARSWVIGMVMAAHASVCCSNAGDDKALRETRSEERGDAQAAANSCTDGDTRTCVGAGACRGGQFCEGGSWSRCDCGDGEQRPASSDAGSEPEPDRTPGLPTTTPMSTPSDPTATETDAGGGSAGTSEAMIGTAGMSTSAAGGGARGGAGGAGGTADADSAGAGGTGHATGGAAAACPEEGYFAAMCQAGAHRFGCAFDSDCDGVECRDGACATTCDDHLDCRHDGLCEAGACHGIPFCNGTYLPQVDSTTLPIRYPLSAWPLWCDGSVSVPPAFSEDIAVDIDLRGGPGLLSSLDAYVAVQAGLADPILGIEVDFDLAGLCWTRIHLETGEVESAGGLFPCAEVQLEGIEDGWEVRAHLEPGDTRLKGLSIGVYIEEDGIRAYLTRAHLIKPASANRSKSLHV